MAISASFSVFCTRGGQSKGCAGLQGVRSMWWCSVAEERDVHRAQGPVCDGVTWSKTALFRPVFTFFQIRNTATLLQKAKSLFAIWSLG